MVRFRYALIVGFLLAGCAPAPETDLSGDGGTIVFVSERICTVEIKSLSPDASVELTFSARPSLTSETVEPRLRLESAGFVLPDRFDFTVDETELFRGRFVFDIPTRAGISANATVRTRQNRRKGYFRLSQAQRQQLSEALAQSKESRLELRRDRGPRVFAIPATLAGYLLDPVQTCSQLRARKSS